MIPSNARQSAIVQATPPDSRLPQRFFSVAGLSPSAFRQRRLSASRHARDKPASPYARPRKKGSSRQDVSQDNPQPTDVWQMRAHTHTPRVATHFCSMNTARSL